MTTTDWHVPDATLVAFARDPRRLDGVAAGSAEAHLLHCPQCRAAVAEASPATLVAASWAEVADVIDAPRRSLLERALTVVGVRATTARLVAATPALSLAWLAAVTVVTAAAVVVAHQRDASTVFLALAPLLPLGAVGVTFAAGADPAGEAGLAAPLAGAGLVLRRATAVLAASLVCLAIGAAALPVLDATAVAWVLPALALASGALALGTWRPVEQAAAGLAGLWLLAVIIAGSRADAGGLAATALLGPPGQLAALTCTTAALAIVAVRRDRLALLGGRP